MEDFRNGGIEITEEIYSWIEDYIRNEGRQRDLARIFGVRDGIISNWRGNKTQKNKYIAWNVWPRVREFFISKGYIRRDDPKYMTREELIVLASQSGDVQLTDKELKVVSIMRALDESALDLFVNICDGAARSLPKKSSSQNGAILKEA